jgi:hypothetical protein
MEFDENPIDEDPIEVDPFEKPNKEKIIPRIRPIRARIPRRPINTKYEDIEILCMLIIIYVFSMNLFSILFV